MSIDRYAVIGHPIGHSRSPFIHARFAAQLSQSLQYSALDVKPARFADAVGNFFGEGGKGLNITVPHKLAVLALCRNLSERAALAASVNTLLMTDGELFGDNTDGVGLVRDLTRLHWPLHGRRVLLLGAGGAARGVLGPLLELAPRALHIANRTVTRAGELVEQFGGVAQIHGVTLQLAPAAGEYDLIINGTAASIAGELPLLPDGALGSRPHCYDMAYGRGDTAFVRAARAAGSTATMGSGMLVEQAAEAFFLWRGLRPDTAPVLAALERELASPAD
jgi:shikimate dehydrogenase